MHLSPQRLSHLDQLPTLLVLMRNVLAHEPHKVVKAQLLLVGLLGFCAEHSRKVPRICGEFCLLHRRQPGMRVPQPRVHYSVVLPKYVFHLPHEHHAVLVCVHAAERVLPLLPRLGCFGPLPRHMGEQRVLTDLRGSPRAARDASNAGEGKQAHRDNGRD